MENSEKSLLINRVIPNVNRKQNKIFCFKYFLISLVVISFVLICGCFYKLYVPFKYEKVFNHIEISSKYDSDTYLPIVNLKVKNTLFEAKLRTNLQTYKLNYFEKIIHLISSFFVSFEIDSKKDSFFKLNTIKYEFNVKKLNQNTNTDDITCFNLSVIADKKTNSLNDMEYCVFLDSYSWFGGHGNFIYYYF